VTDRGAGEDLSEDSVMETGTLGSVRYVAVDPHSAECGRRRTCGSKLRGTSKRVRECQRDTCTCTGERRTESSAVMPYLMRASPAWICVCRTAGEVGVAERRSLVWNSTTKTDCVHRISLRESTHGAQRRIDFFAFVTQYADIRSPVILNMSLDRSTYNDRFRSCNL